MLEKPDISEVETWIDENTLAKTLLEKSHLDSKVLKALLLYYWRNETTFEKIAKKLGLKRSGAWKRWKRGLDSIIRSFYTVELAVYAGVLEVEIAELLAEDLQDYAEMIRGGENIETIQNRLEARMAKLKEML